MNEQVKQIWINALRSGKYEQGRGNLLNNCKFCCLGVLTDLFIIETNQEWHCDYCDYGSHYSFEDEEGILPFSVQEWAGLYAPDPYIAGVSLAKWNDEGASFERIADLIEEHL